MELNISAKSQKVDTDPQLDQYSLASPVSALAKQTAICK